MRCGAALIWRLTRTLAARNVGLTVRSVVLERFMFPPCEKGGVQPGHDGPDATVDAGIVECIEDRICPQLLRYWTSHAEDFSPLAPPSVAPSVAPLLVGLRAQRACRSRCAHGPSRHRSST